MTVLYRAHPTKRLFDALAVVPAYVLIDQGEHLVTGVFLPLLGVDRLGLHPAEESLRGRVVRPSQAGVLPQAQLRGRLDGRVHQHAQRLHGLVPGQADQDGVRHEHHGSSTRARSCGMIGGDGINDESNKTAPAPTRNTDLTKNSAGGAAPDTAQEAKTERMACWWWPQTPRQIPRGPPAASMRAARQHRHARSAWPKAAFPRR